MDINIHKSKKNETFDELKTLSKQLHVYERKTLLGLKKILIIQKKQNCDLDELIRETMLKDLEVMRALQWLSNKNLIYYEKKESEKITINNEIIKQNEELTEIKFLKELINLAKKPLNFIDSKILKNKFNDQEFNIAVGTLKKNNCIAIAKKDNELTLAYLDNYNDFIDKSKKYDNFLKKLPLEYTSIINEDKKIFEELFKRNLVKKTLKTEITIMLKTNGEKIINMHEKELKTIDLIEKIDKEVIFSESWKKKEIRHYDIKINVPKIYGGKRHFVNSATEYARQIWLEMGFKEMSGNMTVSSFWNFDALFTAQDHPVREMQDTFFLKKINSKLPDKKLINNIKKAHEGGADNSIGWQYEWNENDAKKVLLRTHTTCLSSQTLKKIADKKEYPAKYFALGKCFRNETVDWSHGFEFNQTEGIVVDENANFKQLLGYLKEFFNKMGYEKIRIRPAYFPYTEPSLEIEAYLPEQKKWFEIGGAGMFRPEVTVPIFGKHIPVLAWGPGFDRIIMKYFEIKDLRDMYRNNITKLRDTKIWIK